MLRIRDNKATIKRLKFSDDTLNKLQKLISSPVAEEVKKLGIKKLTGLSPCCVCAGIPTHEFTILNTLRGSKDIVRSV